MPTDKTDMLRRLNGKSFTGTLKDGFPVGKGSYRCSNRMSYAGNFSEGMFDGQGTITLPNGGKFVGEWDKGKLVQGTYFYKDGLEYKEQDWMYCTDADHRFWTEIQKGIKVADEPQLTNASSPEFVPPMTYDVGDGYYNPKDNFIYGYDGKQIRKPTPEEAAWAINKCRIGPGSEDAIEGKELEEAENNEETKPTATEPEVNEITELTESSVAEATGENRPYTARPDTAISNISTDSNAGYCPATMGGRHILSTEDPIVCTKCKRKITCSATMGGPHAFIESTGSCGVCNLELDSPLGTNYSRAPSRPMSAASRPATRQAKRPDTSASTFSTMSYSACAASMGGPCNFVDGTCSACNKSINDVTRPPTSAGFGKTQNLMTINSARESERPDTSMTNMTSYSTLSQDFCVATMGRVCEFVENEGKMICPNCGRQSAEGAI